MPRDVPRDMPRSGLDRRRLSSAARSSSPRRVTLDSPRAARPRGAGLDDVVVRAARQRPGEGRRHNLFDRREGQKVTSGGAPTADWSTSSRVGMPPRAQRAAVQRGDGVGILEDVLDVALRGPQAGGGEAAAKRIARARRVDAVDRNAGVRISRPSARARLPSSPSVIPTIGRLNSRPSPRARARAPHSPVRALGKSCGRMMTSISAAGRRCRGAPFRRRNRGNAGLAR